MPPNLEKGKALYNMKLIPPPPITLSSHGSETKSRYDNKRKGTSHLTFLLIFSFFVQIGFPFMRIRLLTR